MPKFRLERDRQGGGTKILPALPWRRGYRQRSGDGRRTRDQEESGNAADCLVPNISATDLEGDFVYCRPDDRSRWPGSPFRRAAEVASSLSSS